MTYSDDKPLVTLHVQGVWRVDCRPPPTYIVQFRVAIEVATSIRLFSVHVVWINRALPVSRRGYKYNPAISGGASSLQEGGE